MPLIRRPLNLTPSGPAVNVILMEQFRQVPPVFFTAVTKPNSRLQCITHDPKQITSCARSMKTVFPDSLGGCLKVNTEAELKSLTDTLLTRPVFLTASVWQSQKKFKKIILRKEKVAVIVNTQQVQIQHHLRTLLAKAMELMRKGKRFVVEIDFNKVLAEWLESVYARLGIQGSSPVWYNSRHARFTVTNHGEKSDFFSYQCADSACATVSWMFCFPCCLLTCPVYMIQRAIRVTDLGGPVPEEICATLFAPIMEISDADRLECLRQVFQRLDGGTPVSAQTVL